MGEILRSAKLEMERFFFIGGGRSWELEAGIDVSRPEFGAEGRDGKGVEGVEAGHGVGGEMNKEEGGCVCGERWAFRRLIGTYSPFPLPGHPEH